MEELPGRPPRTPTRPVRHFRGTRRKTQRCDPSSPRTIADHTQHRQSGQVSRERRRTPPAQPYTSISPHATIDQYLRPARPQATLPTRSLAVGNNRGACPTGSTQANEDPSHQHRSSSTAGGSLPGGPGGSTSRSWTCRSPLRIQPRRAQPPSRGVWMLPPTRKPPSRMG